MNDAPNRSGSLPDPAAALRLVALLDALDPSGGAAYGEVAEGDGFSLDVERARGA